MLLMHPPQTGKRLEEQTERQGQAEKQAENLFLYATLRAGLLEKITHSTFLEEKEKQALEELNVNISRVIGELGMERLQVPGDLNKAVREKGYYLDLFANQPENNFPEQMYVGHIIEKREVILDGETHLFLACHSNQHGFMGAPYPDYIQPETLRAYTNRGITWIDSKAKVRYEKGKKPQAILERLSQDVLRQMKKEGGSNYQMIAARQIKHESKC